MGLGTDMVLGFAAAVSSPWWAVRMLRTGKHRTDWRGRMGHCPPADADDDRPALLLHAVSVGEVNAIRLLVDRLDEQAKAADPAGRGWRIVISATTDTGIARAKQLFEPRFDVVRYPLDFSFAVRRFLDAVRPDLVATVELEVWPNFSNACAKRGIPLCVINGRLSERSHRGYRRIGPLVRPMFRRIAHVAAQSQAIADRFAGVGVPAERITITDTMKWDTAQVADHVDGAEALAAAMGIDRSRPVITAGSTGPGEEPLLIDRCPAEAQLILVPRKPERFEEVAGLASQRGKLVRRTQCPDGTSRPIDGTRLFLLDTMGELRRAYALADVAIVGRSFLGLYGSDMMEPAALARPTIIGPHHSDFADIMHALIEGEGIIVTDEPGKAAGDLLADRERAALLAKRGREVILSRQGATKRTTDLLMNMMPATRTGSC